jgi:hypothetical protein
MISELARKSSGWRISKHILIGSQQHMWAFGCNAVLLQLVPVSGVFDPENDAQQQSANGG